MDAGPHVGPDVDARFIVLAQSPDEPAILPASVQEHLERHAMMRSGGPISHAHAQTDRHHLLALYLHRVCLCIPGAVDIDMGHFK